MDTTTTQHLGQRPGRARRCASVAAVCPSWYRHAVAPAFNGRGTTGVAGFPMDAYVGNTTTLAGARTSRSSSATPGTSNGVDVTKRRTTLAPRPPGSDPAAFFVFHPESHS